MGVSDTPRERQEAGSKIRAGIPVGGGGTASLKVGIHRQTTASAFRHCLPLNCFYWLLLLRVIDHRPPNSNVLKTKLSTDVIQNILNRFLYQECHVSNKVQGIQTSIIS